MGVTQIDGPAYIAGPMTGIPEYNFPAFDRCEKLLKRAYPGLEIENPMRNGSSNGDPGSQPYGYYFRLGLVQLVQCRSIILLPGFANSTGAQKELECALLMGMKAYAFDTLAGTDEFFLVEAS